MAETTDSHANWYTISPEVVGQELQVDPAKGLSMAVAQKRLQQYGPN
ncbi:MAG: hypothetical protein GWP61_24300 [Chloroflexi bacterium]|jgi:hypothetical protein|nr:hypothetical protein [Chloroflexota bacterium]